jgi:hypothetical protein
VKDIKHGKDLSTLSKTETLTKEPRIGDCCTFDPLLPFELGLVDAEAASKELFFRLLPFKYQKENIKKTDQTIWAALHNTHRFVISIHDSRLTQLANEFMSSNRKKYSINALEIKIPRKK